MCGGHVGMRICIFIVLLVQPFVQSANVNLDWRQDVGNQGTTTINQGDTVTWTWSDSKSHSVQSQGTPSFESSSVISSNGFVYSVTFAFSGSYSYRCSIHSSMRGVINVITSTAAPTHVPTTAPTALPTPMPTPAPTDATETMKPTTQVPTSIPTASFRPSLAPTSSAPTIAPSSDTPTGQPTSIPTLDLSKLLDNALQEPPIISSGLNMPTSWELNLTVREHRHSNTQVSFTTRSYCYNNTCMYPGPSIRILPGDNFTLTLVNELGPETDDSSHRHNTFHSPNTTNMHTHGLHIDPAVDTVFVKASPGGSLVYRYHLPSDHAPGLHWYHAHLHGSSTLQLMGGLVGALLVEPDVSNSPNVPESLLQANSKLLVVTKLVLGQEVFGGEVSQGCGEGWACDPTSQGPLCTGAEDSSPFNPFRLYSLQELSAAAGSTMAINPQLVDTTDTDLNLVNGQYRPVIRLALSSPSVFRIVHAAGGGPLQLSLSDKVACVMAVLAWDGVYLDARLPQTELHIVAAARVDIEVTCKEEGLFSMDTNDHSIVWYMYVNASTEVKASVTDEDLAGIIRPWYLQDLTDSDLVIDSEYSVFISQEGHNNSVCGFWLGAGANCSAVTPMGPLTPSPSYEMCPFSQFTGSRGHSLAAYKSAGKLVTFVGAVNEWTLYGLGSAFHPLHVHVNHMQIVSTSAEVSGSDDYYRVGQWRDTIPPVANHVKLRFRAADFQGETVLHCHFQRHEDLGMMDTYLVVNESYYHSVYNPSSMPTRAPTAIPTTFPTSVPTTAPTKGPTVNPTSLPTQAPTNPPTRSPTARPTSAFITASVGGLINVEAASVSADHLTAIETAMEGEIGRGCAVTLTMDTRRRLMMIRRLMTSTIHFQLSLKMEDNTDLSQDTFFNVITNEIDALVTSGALINATNAAHGNSSSALLGIAVTTDADTVTFVPSGSYVILNTGRCSDSIYTQCAENVDNNNGDWAYCDMCMCKEYDSYGDSGDCAANEMLYSCFISSSACKTQFRQSWLVGFAVAGTSVGCLMCGCAFLCLWKSRKKFVSPAEAISGAP